MTLLSTLLKLCSRYHIKARIKWWRLSLIMNLLLISKRYSIWYSSLNSSWNWNWRTNNNSSRNIYLWWNWSRLIWKCYWLRSLNSYTRRALTYVDWWKRCKGLLRIRTKNLSLRRSKSGCSIGSSNMYLWSLRNWRRSKNRVAIFYLSFPWILRWLLWFLMMAIVRHWILLTLLFYKQNT
jgi:hypothetical protein